MQYMRSVWNHAHEQFVTYSMRVLRLSFKGKATVSVFERCGTPQPTCFRFINLCTKTCFNFFTLFWTIRYIF